jgi:SIR2-like domain
VIATSEQILPDQNHIDQIRKRLWCGRDIGQAAVMVGAGFSRNAEKISSNVPNFPLWHELAGKLYDDLNSRFNNDASAKQRAIAGSGALRLASEYEILYGRQALDDLLISMIPDSQYNPGKLHKLLLSLPWSDVFTTNYDNLLERTTPSIHERKYDVVLTYEDIPGRMKPRIVKLHGSFPSHRPFIFTEEDYRTYPKRFSPFVNMVQQSIMENTFCLIGFSGDDPNFLSWIGWVRDNLENFAPPIYLCGLLGLSNSQRQFLLSRRITPVDLSPLFPSSVFLDPNERHFKALEWFLLNLMQGESSSRIHWPEPPQSPDLRRWEPSSNLPPIPSQPLPSYSLGKMNPYDY